MSGYLSFKAASKQATILKDECLPLIQIFINYLTKYYLQTGSLKGNRSILSKALLKSSNY